MTDNKPLEQLMVSAISEHVIRVISEQKKKRKWNQLEEKETGFRFIDHDTNIEYLIYTHVTSPILTIRNADDLSELRVLQTKYRITSEQYEKIMQIVKQP